MVFDFRHSLVSSFKTIMVLFCCQKYWSLAKKLPEFLEPWSLSEFLEPLCRTDGSNPNGYKKSNLARSSCNCPYTYELSGDACYCFLALVCTYCTCPFVCLTLDSKLRMYKEGFKKTFSRNFLILRRFCYHYNGHFSRILSANP